MILSFVALPRNSVQIGGTYLFLMAPRHAQLVEQGLQILGERCTQPRTVLAEASQHVAGGSLPRFARGRISNGR